MMAGMDVDSVPPDAASSLSTPRHRVVQRLVKLGIPLDPANATPSSLVDCVKQNESWVPNLVSSILPTDGDVAELRKLFKKESEGGVRSAKMKELYAESFLWIEWLMFGCDPQDFLKDMARRAAGQRAVCGAVWGHNDLAYRCRTCEHDPTCAICVSCFKNGNHKDHDYSIMYTGGGCCDCGDETAWKPEGFCSKHRGVRQIQPLSEDLERSAMPVIDVLLKCWQDKVLLAELWKRTRDGNRSDPRKIVANELSSAIVCRLLDFCECSESLLSFISRRIFECSGLLDALVRAERFLDKEVVKKLHELLLKLLGEPVFKYEFAKVLKEYYPITVREILKEGSDSALEKHALLPTFSVQIFTVPTLTTRLVREVDLLGALLGCLMDIFNSSVGDDGQLQVNKWANIYETTLRLVEDTRYVMSHDEVTRYVVQERPDITRTWLKLLSLVQGMDPQKRATGIHTEEDNDNVPAPFVLCFYLGNVNSLFVGGAFSVTESKDKSDSVAEHFAKAEKHPQSSATDSMMDESDASDCHSQYRGVSADKGSLKAIPNSVVWLIFECLKAVESCLDPASAPRGNLLSLDASSSNSSNVFSLRRNLFTTGGRNRDSRAYTSGTTINGAQVPARDQRFDNSRLFGERDEASTGGDDPMDVTDESDVIPENSSLCPMLSDCHEKTNSGVESEALKFLSLADWPDIEYDVSSKEISFHIPLHRLLGLLLRKALKTCYEETGTSLKVKGSFSVASSEHYKFFEQVLKGVHPSGFSAYVMENPLRLRVFCAQVRAGMWRRNGDAAIFCCEWYRSVQWLEIGLEPDLFLLQCCAALAPPELFVKRIQERFGLTNYTALSLADHNEYEPVLVQEMLTLIIQIVKERRFCGLSTSENLRRELVYKLAVGDATHSQLVKALPRDLSKSNQLRSVLDELAVYSKPSGMKQGKYSLRKKFWKELDLYHPRWSSRDLQTAEEQYLRFCKVSALNVQLPQWTKILWPLSTISRIATSKSVLQIIHAVTFYALFSESSSLSHAPDNVLITALHLLSLALDICETMRSCMDMPSQADDLFPTITYACEEFNAGTTDENSCRRESLLSLLVSLMRKHKVENYYNCSETRHCNISELIENVLKKFAQISPACLDKLKRLAPEIIYEMPHQSLKAAKDTSASTSDMEEWRARSRQRQAEIMEKMKSEQSRFIASLSSDANGEPDIAKYDQKISSSGVDNAPEESDSICSLCRGSDSESPLCFLVLLQKSKLTSFVERGPISWDDDDQSDNKMQLVSNKGATEASHDGLQIPDRLVRNACLDTAYGMDFGDVYAFKDRFDEWLPEAKDIQLSKASDSPTSSLLTLEMLENDIYQSVMAEIDGSQYHSSSSNGKLNCSTSQLLVGPLESNSAESYVLGGSGISRKISTNQCSTMDDSHTNSDSTVIVTRFRGFGPKGCDGIHISSCGHAVHQECHDRYLTSLKQRHLRRLGFEGGHIVDPDLGELLCPVCRKFSNSILPTFSAGVSSKSLRQMISPRGSLTNNLHLPSALSLLRSTAKTVGRGRFKRGFLKKQNKVVNSALEPALRKLCSLYSFESYDNLSASGRFTQSQILWNTLTYSLVSTEIAARGQPKAYTADSLSLKALYGEFHSSSESILSLLFSVALTAQTSSRHDVLLRFQGIQLLAGSILVGVSGGNLSNSGGRRGSLSSVSGQDEMETDFPDSLFHKQVSDPILAHDPFSSLMWALYCLPSPVMSSSGFLFSLVHLFYYVCVIQAMITCYSRDYVDVSCFGDCILNDICKMMGETEYVKKFFVSNYIDVYCHPKDMIRRFTLPYLRRCALLWKMLQSSLSAPLHDISLIFESSAVTVELNAIKELEDMFRIHSLELVLNNEIVHSLALKWCDHFCDEFGGRNYGSALFSTPAVPFKLIQLPHLYQDLLQRYVKKQCPNCKAVPDEPALCLLCGSICSPNFKPCCRSSRFLNHATTCGAGIGVFLLVRRTTVFLQRSLRESAWPSPYLDAFGEEDREMHRGKPLYLNEERYAALTYLVASHGLDRTSEVLRQTTISFNGLD